MYKEKPLHFVMIGSEIKKYEITFARNSQHYEFYNSEKLVDDFLSNARKRVLNDRANRNGFSIVPGFSIENKQLIPFATNAYDVILNSRYWSTVPFQTRLFND